MEAVGCRACSAYRDLRLVRPERKPGRVPESRFREKSKALRLRSSVMAEGMEPWRALPERELRNHRERADTARAGKELDT